jgi:hypothetical protein
MRAANDGVTDAKRTALDDDRGERTTAHLHLGLDDHAAGLGLRVGLQLEHVGLKQNHFEQFGDTLALDGRDRHRDRLATPVFRSDLALLHLLLHALYVRALSRPSC